MTFDPFSDRPRTRCEDCGGPLVFDGAAVPYLRRCEPATSSTLMGLYGAGGTLYACSRCGLMGAFSPITNGNHA